MRDIFRAGSLGTPVLACSVFIIAFGALLADNQVIAFVVLGFALTSMILDITRGSRVTRFQLLGLNAAAPHWWMTAIFIGSIVGFGLRAVQGSEDFAIPILSSIFIAGGVGLCEELTYRGYFLGRLLEFQIPPFAAVLFVSSIHTAYKVAVVDAHENHAVQLAIFTFVGGIVLGLMRLRSQSIVPPVLAHSLFDVVVYGDRPLPDWVW